MNLKSCGKNYWPPTRNEWCHVWLNFPKTSWRVRRSPPITANHRRGRGGQSITRSESCAISVIKSRQEIYRYRHRLPRPYKELRKLKDSTESTIVALAVVRAYSPWHCLCITTLYTARRLSFVTPSPLSSLPVIFTSSPISWSLLQPTITSTTATVAC